ncbi:MAG: FtsL-like putative cell division protein [Chitinophagales bacterium]|nr:FtsL-like putative cell division protein [Chitinophagales bacterium]
MKLKSGFTEIGKKILRMDFNSMLTMESMVANMPYFLFLVVLAMVYISNTHTVEGTIRSIDKMKTELKEVRWNFMATKSDLMYKSKQTEVAKAVEEMGLKEITSPPIKIEIVE